MKKIIFLVSLVAVSACLFGVHMQSLEAHQHRSPGEKVDDAIDSTKDAIDKAKDKTKDGMDKIKDKTKEGLDKAKDKLED